MAEPLPPTPTGAPASPPEHELDHGRMPFFSHLRELRDRVRSASVYFGVAFIGCFYFSKQIYRWLQVPLFEVWARQEQTLGPPNMVFSSVTEPFWVYMSVALWAGIFVASPFIFFQLWRFVAPGLYKRERRVGVVFALFSGVFFVSGALFCYHMVLERLYEFLLGYATAELRPMLVMKDYLDLTRNMMLAFGGVFELPLLIYFLALANLVTPRGLWRFNRWFVVLAFVVGAILTPSPDVVSQIMMAVPMILLYNLSIIAAHFVYRGKKRREAEELAREASGNP
ncbi:MAG: twin-arginine translocase subunit TatC [Myxococcales bacterium]|nr:twin-arginine translocase subunit TatC [Myxococcales bacterium]HRC57672.1 twin-arginine translocase subunit TatC [Kofleriaceae bacterium]